MYWPSGKEKILARLGRPRINWRERALKAEAGLAAIKPTNESLRIVHDDLVAKHHKCEILLEHLLNEKLEAALRQSADDSGLSFKDILELSLPVFSKILMEPNPFTVPLKKL